MGVHPTKNGINRYWFIAIYQQGMCAITKALQEPWSSWTQLYPGSSPLWLKMGCPQNQMWNGHPQFSSATFLNCWPVDIWTHHLDRDLVGDMGCFSAKKDQPCVRLLTLEWLDSFFYYMNCSWCISIYPSIYLSIFLSIYLSMFLSCYLSTCLPV